jgi:hypothetical protein
MLIYSREGSTSADANSAVPQQHQAVMDEARQRGIFHGAEPLEPTSTAVTVRRKADGKIMTIDGPFAETKEQLAGYYILDCENIDEAIEWASKIPTGCLGREGCIEVRPIRPMNQ